VGGWWQRKPSQSWYWSRKWPFPGPTCPGRCWSWYSHPDSGYRFNLELQVYGRPGSVKVVGTNDEDTLCGLWEIAVGGA
jgi:hypothetical protein